MSRVRSLPWGSLAPFAIVALAFALRIWAARFEPWVTIDGTDYIRFAESLLRGEAYTSIFPPGYPLLIALARFAIVDRVAAASAVSLVAGGLLPLPVWLLARRALGPGLALVPALVVAVHPSLIESSTLTMSDSAYLLLLYGTLCLAARSWPLATGLGLGAAFAVRPEALLPAGVLALREIREKGARALRPLLLLGAGLLVFGIPCWLYFHATLGVWTLTPKVAAAVRAPGRTWVEEEPRLGPATPSERYDLIERLAQQGPEALRRYPAGAIAYGRGLLQLWPLPLLALSIWGLARRRGLESIPLLHLGLLPLFALGMQTRFLLGAIPALAISATAPLVGARRGMRMAIASTGALGAVLCVAGLWNELVLPLEGNAGAQQEAGIWLAGAAESDAIVMDRKPQVAFYSGRRYSVMPDEPYDTLIDAAVRRGVRYLVVDEGVAKVFRPQLLPLLYSPTAREREPRLEMIYAGGHFQGYGVTIFRVLRPGETKSGRPPVMAVRWLAPPAPPP